MAKVEDFKYLGPTVLSTLNKGCGREVKKRVQAGWNGSRRMSGVICDRAREGVQGGRKTSNVVRVGDGDTDKTQEAEMEVAEMLRFSLGVTRMDKIRRMLRMELPGKRKRGRPKRRFKWMW